MKASSDRRPMTDTQARQHSKQALETGYDKWLESAIAQIAYDEFIATDPSNEVKLREARIKFDLAQLARTVIRDNAR